MRKWADREDDGELSFAIAIGRSHGGGVGGDVLLHAGAWTEDVRARGCVFRAGRCAEMGGLLVWACSEAKR